jgi:Tfp pilus assembly protein PilZ
MPEKRREERKTLVSFTPVYNLRNNYLLGYLRDLTVKGAMLEGYRLVELNEKLIVGIEFNETPEFSGGRLVLSTRVAWCKHVENSNYYNIGVEFQDLTAENKTVIVAVLDRYTFRPEPPA